MSTALEEDGYKGHDLSFAFLANDIPHSDLDIILKPAQSTDSGLTLAQFITKSKKLKPSNETVAIGGKHFKVISHIHLEVTTSLSMIGDIDSLSDDEEVDFAGDVLTGSPIIAFLAPIASELGSNFLKQTGGAILTDVSTYITSAFHNWLFPPQPSEQQKQQLAELRVRGWKPSNLSLLSVYLGPALSRELARLGKLITQNKISEDEKGIMADTMYLLPVYAMNSFLNSTVNEVLFPLFKQAWNIAYGRNRDALVKAVSASNRFFNTDPESLDPREVFDQLDPNSNEKWVRETFDLIMPIMFEYSQDTLARPRKDAYQLALYAKENGVSFYKSNFDFKMNPVLWVENAKKSPPPVDPKKDKDGVLIPDHPQPSPPSPTPDMPITPISPTPQHVASNDVLVTPWGVIQMMSGAKSLSSLYDLGAKIIEAKQKSKFIFPSFGNLAVANSGSSLGFFGDIGDIDYIGGWRKRVRRARRASREERKMRNIETRNETNRRRNARKLRKQDVKDQKIENKYNDEVMPPSSSESSAEEENLNSINNQQYGPAVTSDEEFNNASASAEDDSNTDETGDIGYLVGSPLTGGFKDIWSSASKLFGKKSGSSQGIDRALNVASKIPIPWISLPAKGINSLRKSSSVFTSPIIQDNTFKPSDTLSSAIGDGSVSALQRQPLYLSNDIINSVSNNFSSFTKGMELMLWFTKLGSGDVTIKNNTL
jgi:type II secretory pathway pseudopilin PulG